MARGRPRKDGSKPKEKEVEPDPDPEVILEGARTKRKAATACIKSVMSRYNITPSDEKKDDTDQLVSDNDNSSKLVKSPSGDNDRSDQVSKHHDTASVSGKVDKSPDDSCEKCDETFENVDCLQLHMRRIHKEEENGEILVNNPSKASGGRFLLKAQ